MSDSIRTADHVWKDGGLLIDRLEHLSRSDTSVAVVCAEAVNGLLTVSRGVACTLQLIEPEQTLTLSRSGIDVPPTILQGQGVPAGRAAIASWPKPETLIVIQAFDAVSFTQLCLQFNGPPYPPLLQPLAELSEAVLQIVTQVYLRDQFSQLRKGSQAFRNDGWADGFYGGVTLSESFSAVGESIAQRTGSDRAFVLRFVSGDYRLIAASSQPVVDRRSQQVRLLEAFVNKALQGRNQFRFTAGSPEVNEVVDSSLDDSLQRYLVSSGARCVQVDRVVKDDDDQTPVAAIVTEAFQLPEIADQREQFARVNAVATSAIRLAIKRAEAVSGFPVLLDQFSRFTGKRKTLAFVSVLSLVAAVLLLVPCELKLPVDGRVVAKQQRYLFAPMDADIAQVVVRNGQSVNAGDLLIRLRSPELSLLGQQLQGELATAKTQLTAIKALGAAAGAADKVNKEVLITKVSGLEKQLAIVDQRAAQLSVVSPIDGIVDRWDLQQTLRSRPVAHGDYLLNVVAPNAGWEIELDIPEQESVYVTKRQAVEACDCTYRLRLTDGEDYQSRIEQVSQVASTADDGQPVVVARMPLTLHDKTDIRSGATVKAWVHCGKRSLGFVWFRQVIQWARQRGW